MWKTVGKMRELAMASPNHCYLEDCGTSTEEWQVFPDGTMRYSVYDKASDFVLYETSYPAQLPKTASHVAVYQKLATTFMAYRNCLEAMGPQTSHNHKHYATLADRHWETIKGIVKDSLPHGSGIDTDLQFDFSKSGFDRLLIHGEYHNMDDCGNYDGWTQFTVAVIPSLSFDFQVEVEVSDYDLIRVKDRTHAELCWLLKLDYSTKGYKIVDTVYDLRDYLGEIFHEALSAEIKEGN